MSNKEPRYDVFISYARNDGRDFAERLDQALISDGFRTWRDTRNIDPAKDFTAEIERAIELSSCVVVCITPDTKRDNSFVRREIQYALLSNKRVIVARMDDIVPPIHVVNNTWVDFHMGWEEAFRELCDSLMEGTQAPAQPDLSPHSSDPFRSYTQALYQKIVDFLDHAVTKLMDRSLEEANDVARPFRAGTMDQVFEARALKASLSKPRVFPEFVDAFEHYDGRVMLLGEPGAGKTVTLMVFGRDAAARRLSDSTAALPLLGWPSTWDADQQTPFDRWLADGFGELNASRVRETLDAGQALLLLDGLDELGTRRRDPVTEEYYDPKQRFLQNLPNKNRIVISCRLKEYQDIKRHVRLRGLVQLRPLSDEQMESFLSEQPGLREAIAKDSNLREIARVPLVLNLLAFAYQNQAQEVMEFQSLREYPEDLRDRIFRTYVKLRYEYEANRTNTSISITLEDLYKAIGDVAMWNAQYGKATANQLRLTDFDIEYSSFKREEFIQLLVQLNLLYEGEADETWSFVHVLFRNHFAIRRALYLLNDSNADIRVDAAETLGYLDDARAIAPLCKALKDQDWRVRRNAANALGELRDEHSVKALLDALDDEHWSVRRSAADSLRLIGTPEALAALAQWYPKEEVRLSSLREEQTVNTKEPRLRHRPAVSQGIDDARVREAAARIKQVVEQYDRIRAQKKARLRKKWWQFWK